jgi:hypothetical protein
MLDYIQIDNTQIVVIKIFSFDLAQVKLSLDRKYLF